ncbi:MAG: FG-GAP-like repeat-containing protein [Pyrinomonadaceae bacterium]
MKRFFASLLIVALCALAFPYLFVRAQDRGPQSPSPLARPDRDLSRLVRKHQRVRLNAQEAARSVRTTGRLSLITGEESFELELEPNDLRAKTYRAEETGTDGSRRELESGAVRTYKGEALGREDAQARFTIDECAIEGLIITPDERYYIEPLSKYDAGADETEFVFYKRSDVIDDSPGMCGATMNEKVNEAVRGIAPQVAEATAAGGTYALLEAEVATEADYEYVSALGSSAAANQEILSIMNQVDGVYDRELGIRLKVVYQHAWAAKPISYPYTSTATGTTILQEFTNHWNVNFASVQRDVAHMWTGKEMVNAANDPGLIGIAWGGVVCRAPDHAYGVSQRLTSIAHKYVLTAHEIGHNFDASHSDGQTGCDDTVMRSYIGTTLSFCSFSRGEIRTYNGNITNAACLTPIQVPCGYTLTPASTNLAATGGNGTVTVTTRGACGWRAKSTASWITITAGLTGAGNGTVKFSVAANNAATARTGALTIGDKTFSVTQGANNISSLVVSPATVLSGQPATGTITLSVPSPSTGLTVGLSSNSTAVSVSPQVNIPAGAQSQTFPITTAVVSGAQTGAITAKLGEATKTASLGIKGLTLSSLQLSQNAVAGGNSVTGTLTLSGPAPSTGSIITLSDNIAAANLPASITIPVGSTSATFTITTATVTANQAGAVTAAYNGLGKSAPFTVRPVGVLSVEVSPALITGGNAANGTVFLERPAPVDVTVTLTDTLAATTIPASIVVPSGAASKSFSITSATVTAFQNGTLTARANGVSKSVTFALTPGGTTSCVAPSFTTASKVSLVTPYVVADDLNQDGKVDLVGPSGNSLAVLLGNGLGGFATAVRYPVATTRVAVADFNLDGKRDIAATDDKTGKVSILPGDGTGRFGPAASFPAGWNAMYIAVGDFNKDAKPDLAIAGQYRSGQLTILLGNGAGGFSSTKYYSAYDDTYGIVAEDFNGDGQLDVALANSRSVTTWLGDGAGKLTKDKSTDLGVNSKLSGLASADFNKDGKMDLAVTIISTNQVAILRGNGLGGFTVPLKYTVGQNPSQVVIGDLNADNKADLIVPNSGTHDVSVLFGTNPGNFSLPRHFALGGTPLAPKVVALGDFNGDNRPDLAVPMSSNLSIMVNTCQ